MFKWENGHSEMAMTVMMSDDDDDDDDGGGGDEHNTNENQLRINRTSSDFYHRFQSLYVKGVEFYLYPTVGTVLIHSVKPELTE